MPISKPEFENLPANTERHPESQRVDDFLDENDDYGYTATEIANRLELDVWTVTDILIDLHDRDKVRLKGEYWATKNE